MAGENNLDDFCDSLKSQRLIKIFVGSGEEQEGPFLVQEAVLCASSSSDYFGKALKHARSMGDGEPDGLRFPDDNKQAWKTFLSWLLKRGGRPDFVNDLETQLLLVQAWILGDKYMLSRFQDVVMYALIELLEFESIEQETVIVAFHGTTSESALRKIVAEEAVYSIYFAEKHEPSFLHALDGAPGAIASIAEAVKVSQDREPDGGLCQLGDYPGRTDDGRWKCFMVSGPEHRPRWD